MPYSIIVQKIGEEYVNGGKNINFTLSPSSDATLTYSEDLLYKAKTNQIGEDEGRDTTMLSGDNFSAD